MSTTKKTFWSKLFDWIIEKSLKDLIDYIKEIVGEATIAADLNTFGGWSSFLLALIKDLLEGYKQINSTGIATKSASSVPVTSTPVYRTLTAKELIKKAK
jgi:hypothetical protein